MAKVTREMLTAIRTSFEQYKEEVENAGLKKATEMTYLRHADTFIRWLDDDFEPGATLRR